METAFRNNWSLGWMPGMDEHNGPKNCLLRMDNVTIDEEGSLNLARGTKRISSGTMAGGINKIFSRNVPGSVVGRPEDLVKLRYISHNDLVVRNYGVLGTATDFDTGIITSGGSSITAFGTGWDQIFIFSGSKKVRDKGSSQAELGIPANSPPAVTVNAPPVVDIMGTYASWTGLEGSLTFPAADVNLLNSDDTSLRGIAQIVRDCDMTNLGGAGVETPNDMFKVFVRPGDTSKVVKIRVEILLDTPTGSTSPDVKDYYWFEWILRENFEVSPDYFDPDLYSYTDREEFIKAVQENIAPGVTFETFPRIGTNYWGQIQCLRKQFKRVGTDDSKNWSNTKAVRISFLCTEDSTLGFGYMKFEGGALGSLNGWYSYLQVDVYRDGNYLEIGLPSNPTERMILNANTTVTPTTVNGWANECWIYRASTGTPGYFFLYRQAGALGFTPTSFPDAVSDIDIVRQNTGIEYGRLEQYRSPLPAGIEFVVGPYFDRMLYFDKTSLYISYKFDAGTHDSRSARQITGDSNEIILWVAPVIDGLILVGTTEDIYTIKGDFSYDPVTTLLDCTIDSLGIEQPPVHKAMAVYGTSIIYIAEDGWRVLEGTNSYLLSPQLDMLYKGYSRYGIDPVALNGRNSQVFRAVVSKSRFIASVHHETLGRALHVYDFNKKHWRFWRNIADYRDNPQELYVDDDGTVLFGTAYDGDNFLYQWDIGTQLREAVDQQVYLQFIHEDCDKPHVFKDGLCFKIVGYTAGDNLTLDIKALKDDGTYTTNSFSYNSNTRGSVKYYALNEAMLGRSYQVTISGTCTDFELNAFSLAYLSREEKVTWLRLPAMNFGEACAKQIVLIPLRLNTFGANVDINPYFDNAAKTVVTANTTHKNPTVFCYFNAEWVNDVEFIIEGGANPFEFLGIEKPEIIAVGKRIKYLRIPATDFGESGSKQIASLPIRLNTFGAALSITPYFDNVAKTPQNVTTTLKNPTAFLYFSGEWAVDVELLLGDGSAIFEFQELGKPEILSIAKKVKYHKISTTNFGSPDKKLIPRVHLIANTDGQNVVVTPKIDNIGLTPITINSSYRKTHCLYLGSNYFTDLELELIGTYPFELVKLEQPQILDVIKLHKYFKFRGTNLGTDDLKLIHRLGFICNTDGNDAILTPIIDGTAYDSLTINGTYDKIHWYYFTSPIWMNHVGFIVSSPNTFDEPVLVPPEMMDRIKLLKAQRYGPIPINRQANIKMIRLHYFTYGTPISYTLFEQGVSLVSGDIVSTLNKRCVSEILLSKSIKASVVEFLFTSAYQFHIFRIDIKFEQTGNETENQWVTLDGQNI